MSALSAEPAEWDLYFHPALQQQLDKLSARVDALKARDPKGYTDLPATKLLFTINRYITEIVPRNPSAAEFRQGNTLGVDNRHWFRAKFHERYRLFYRFSTKEKVIVYAWVNDETSLRKAGSRTDPYSIFHAMLSAGDPPATMAELLAVSKRIETPGSRIQSSRKTFAGPR